MRKLRAWVVRLGSLFNKQRNDWELAEEIESHVHIIRMALGASRRGVLGLMFMQGMRSALVGIFFGVAGSLALKKVMVAHLFGVSPTDPATFVVVAALLMLVAAAACLLPAQRAARLDPMRVLRHE